jgi:signal transduction histidine kinase
MVVKLKWKQQKVMEQHSLPDCLFNIYLSATKRLMKKAFIAILFLFHLPGAYTQNTHYDSLKNLISAAKDDSTRYLKTEDLIWGYLYSIPDSASLYVRQNILLAQKMKSDDALYKAYIQYAILEQINGNYTGALQYTILGLRVAEHMNNLISICEAYFNFGNLYGEAGDFEQAIYYVRKAKSLLESKAGSDLEQKDYEIASHYVECFVLLSQTFEIFNQLDSALQYANTAHALSLKGLGKWGTVKDTLFFSQNLAPTIGNIYSKKGDYSTALNYYRLGASIANGNKDLMDNYNGAANTFKKEGQLDSSIFYANKVLDLSKEAHFLIGKLQALNLLSDIYILKHNTDSVVKYLQLSIQTKDSLFNTKKVVEIQNIAFSEQLRQQEIKDEAQQYQNRLRMYMLAGGLVVLLLLAGILYRNNVQKQKSNVKIEKAYKELKSTQAQLIQSEKMASLGELTAGIAHEIQNPLNFVNNFSEVNKDLVGELQTELKAGNTNEAIIISNDIKENEEKISHHGKRADAIVKNMLQHSRKSTGQKEPTDINALCDEYLRLSYHGFRAKDKNFNAEIKRDLDQSIGKINIVPQDIGRVLLNLFNNAFYAVSERQKVEDEPYKAVVKVATKVLAPSPLERAGGEVEIRVTDNGNGIPSNIIAKIFQPFFTTKPPGQGTGLGLSLAYDIIKAHGGEIKVETKEGEGSEFVIYIPA